MLGRIVEVSNDKRHLSVYRGFMLVHSTGKTGKKWGVCRSMTSRP